MSLLVTTGARDLARSDGDAAGVPEALAHIAHIGACVHGRRLPTEVVKDAKRRM